MTLTVERLRQEHRRLNRIIDNCRSAARQAEMKELKRLRLKLKDRMFRLQRFTSPSTP